MTDAAMPQGGKQAFGRIKPSFRAADHSGWYLLDGRAAATLPGDAPAAAAGIGITTLPDASDRTVRDGAAAAFGTLDGGNSMTIALANMPAYTLTGTADQQTVTHTHTITGWNNVQGTSGNQAADGSPAQGGSEPFNLAIQSGGAHTHAFNVASGGGGAAIDTQNPWIGVNWFIYLGA